MPRAATLRSKQVSDLLALLLTAVLAALYFGLGPSTGPIAFVLQMGAVGATVGLVIALYRTERDRGFPLQLLVARWTVAGVVTGLLVALVNAVLFS
jgi:hypothetical protein